VALPSATVTREEIQALFETAYFNRFQVRLPEIKAVLVNLVTSVVGKRRAFPVSALLDESDRGKSVANAVIGERRLYASGAWHTATILDRGRLPLGATVAGPAVVQQIDATTVVEPGAVAHVDKVGNLRISVGRAA
jgi:N-methylhydantoinase A